MDEVWRLVREDLQGRVSNNCFKIWIDPLVPLTTTGNGVTLTCPNRFFLNWIREHYLVDIKRSWERFAGAPGEIELQVAAKPRRPREDPEESGQMPLDLPVPTNGRGRRLNRRFTFDQFVVGEGNKYAFSAALAMATGKSSRHNFLYLLADTGLGKSHLSHAIGNHILSENPTLRVLYVTTEEFANEMVLSLKQRRMETFKEKYRSGCDVLLLEEVQFLSGKEKTQAEITYTLDSLCQDQKRVVFTGTQYPKDIPNLKSRLQSRLSSGMVTHIEPPDFETRCKILEQKAAHEAIRLPGNVTELLARSITNDIRQLESAVIGIVAKSSLMGKPIDLKLAREVLDGVCGDRQSIGIDRIVQLICQYFKVSVEALQSNSRKKSVVHPRNLSMFLCRKYTHETLETIGRAFNRSHATVIYAVEAITREMERKAALHNQVEFLSQQVANGGTLLSAQANPQRQATSMSPSRP
jgi:chromosomal replication initiator protein